MAEDDIPAAARPRAEEVGVAPIGSGGGAALRFPASVLDARAVVEIGTGTGVSGLWLLRGMRSDGVLTTVDIEAEHQRLAKETFNDAGIPANRARTIAGAGLDVLPRLTDGHYDSVFCDGDKREYAAYLAEALRLLRPGGVVAFDNALWHDRVADPAQRDEETVAIRDLGRTIADNESLVPVLLPVGDGLLVAKKVWTPET
ncbi:O-methyltransferase [Nocardioides sp. B-3]|uniref:O-methyltransferase n=1 Tax=Nocardioides sp. B-3 TaxID=2895565 RepID=UPI0021528678|nr:O-methyltransferase [Nocardioides sp. B-3]UUZ60159.1 O-methyltransferase [Nocardioides sp. B-3]